MFVPKINGGLQTCLPEALKIEEALAAIDGSLGWTVTLCSGAGLFAGFVTSELRAQLFNDPDLCFGGSGMASGTAERVPGGYLVNGDWRYATGAPHLTAFSANCHILEDGRAVINEAGEGAIRSFLFLPEEVEMREDWPVMGLRATASHSFSVQDRIVPESRSFLIRPECATDADPVYQYPFIQFAELTLAANFGGMALGFLECFSEMISGHGAGDARKSLRLQKLQTAQTGLDALRTSFHETAAMSWEQMTKDGMINSTGLKQISSASRDLATGVRRMVTELIPFAGIAAADPGTRMNRIWRDLFTATQHSLLNYPA